MRVLHLEDSPHDAALTRNLLEMEWPEVEITLVNTRQDFLAALTDGGHDIILSDFRLPNFNGRDALSLARQHRPDLPFIFISGTVGEDVAAEIVRAGAADYLIKDRMQRLPIAIRRALQDSETQRQNRLAAQRIREQAELLSQARDGIIVTDLESRITFWNRGAERIFGWTADEVAGRSTLTLYAQEASDEIRGMHREAAKNEAWHGILRLRNKQQQPVIAEVHVTLIRDDAGNPKSRLKIITDITEKQALEEKFLRAQRLESLGLLAAGIAHDLNNILAPVLMSAPLLRSSAVNSSDLRMLDAIENSAIRGAALVRQILSFAHGSHSNMILVQPKHILRDIVDLIRQSFPKFIELDCEIPNDLGTINGNPTKLHQVMLNLCVNARDAMPKGGKLHLRAGNKTLDKQEADAISDAQPGDYVVLEVGDTGVGIPPELLVRIWDPFFTTKGEAKGTGLGLATVRGIMQTHGGFVAVESEPGRGTTFRVFFPVAESGNSSVRSADSAHPFALRGQGELILIADDEETIRSLLTALLTRSGYRILAARNGAEALALFAPRAGEISLVISDLNMPEMGGYGLAQALPALAPDVKILFMSGAGSGPDHGEPLPVAARVVKKPFVANDLLVAVREVLGAPPASKPG